MDVTALPAHVHLEASSVLTRLPGGLAGPPATAASVLAERFDAPPLRLDDAARGELLRTLAAAQVAGGASYDGLVALEADAHGRVLLTLDRRARAVHARLGADHEALDA